MTDEEFRAQLVANSPHRATKDSLISALLSTGAVHVQLKEEYKIYVAPWTWKHFFKNCWRVLRFKKRQSLKTPYPSVQMEWCEGPTEEEATEIIEDWRPAGVSIELKKRFP